MARILMTWEMGAGYGHIAPLLALAKPLVAAGHDVTFAVRDPATAEFLLRGAGFPILQAPANMNIADGLVLHSFAQILLHTSFNHVEEVINRARIWRTLFATVKPDLLICDHSPGALLAARGTGLKCAAVGYGFTLPPDVHPLPNLRPWNDTDAVAVARDESRVLGIANAALGVLGAPALDYVAQLYGSNGQALFTCKELDSYAAERQSAEYLGPLLYMGGGKRPKWPPGVGQRVFAYIRPFEAQATLLEALRQSGQPTLIHAPHIAPILLERYAGSNLLFSAEPLDIAAVARECDLAILHGGHGILALMLLAGKPLLVLPLHLEMLLNANCMLKLGAGLVVPQLRPEGIRHKLALLLEEPTFGDAARRFAERYAGLDVEKVAAGFVPRIAQMLAA